MTARRRGPFNRISLVRLGVAVVIVGTAVLAIVLPGGIFRALFRGAVIFGAIVIIGSYLLQWWLRRRRRP